MSVYSQDIQSVLASLITKNGAVIHRKVLALPDNSDADPKLIERIMMAKRETADEEAFWETLLPKISAESLSDAVICYLYEREIAVVEMAHKPLSEYWLEKYIRFDDAPVFTLAKRYFAEQKSSDNMLLHFAWSHLFTNSNLYEHLMSLYYSFPNGLRVLQFGTFYPEQEIISTSRKWLNIFMTQSNADPAAIAAAYEEHRTEGDWLRAIASNPCTPEWVLEELMACKGIQNSREIRVKSREKLLIQKKLSEMGGCSLP